MYAVIIETNWLDNPIFFMKDEDGDLYIFHSLDEIYELSKEHMLGVFPWHILDMTVMEFVEIV